MSFNIPNSIATGSSDPYWAYLVPSSTTANPDTATKKHYAATGSGGPTDVVFELNNGIITVDVNASFTGSDWPDSVSKTGFQNNPSSSVVVTAGNTVYIFNNGGTNFGSFVWQSSWVTTSGGGGGFLGGGQSFASGSISHFGSSITWSIDPNSPSTGTGSDFYYLKRDNSIYYSYGITHQNGYSTTHTIATLVGVWKLWHEDQNGFTLLDEVTVTATPNSVKASCNFW